jgi:transposase
MAAVLTAGERHEQIALEPLLDRGAVQRPGRGRPRLRPRHLAGDRGYSRPVAQRRIRRRGIQPVIPTRKDQRRLPHFNREAYRRRSAVARMIGRLKQFRCRATRHEACRQLPRHDHHRHGAALAVDGFADTP